VSYFWFAECGGEPWVKLLFVTFSLNTATGPLGERVKWKSLS
jgi:hypothetical protein